MKPGTLLGVRVGPRPLAELTSRARLAIESRTETFTFACANPHSLVVARGDAEFRKALNSASAVVADGIGCQWGARIARAPVGPRITGYDFFVAMMLVVNETHGKVLFFGSSDEVLARVRHRLSKDFPGVTAAMLSPPYGAWSPEENEAMVRRIVEFAPDILWVGMTAPKQEKWVAANIEGIRVPVVGSIGAVFDYYAEVTHRAPPWVCRWGLEWLYRLPREPRRLWRRTLVSAPLFLWHVIRDCVTDLQH